MIVGATSISSFSSCIQAYTLGPNLGGANHTSPTPRESKGQMQHYLLQTGINPIIET